MNGYWTYSNSELKWENDSFKTKPEAITAAKNDDQETVFVGQLQEESELVYKMVNVEEVFVS